MKKTNKLTLLLLTLSITAGLSVTGCMKAEAADAGDNSDAAFGYREVYLPESTGENARALGLNNLDNDWALWGHNLANILPEKKSETIYAKRNGSTAHNQYCFMSEKLYEYISEHIDRKYGDDTSARFAILPNDNDIVCLCEKCVEIGNTPKDASPALFNMINRLAAQYPNHHFYTSYYRTAKGFPEERLPENVGVIVSTMDYPPSYVPTAEENQFLNILARWNHKTNRIFVWDYVNNFDDYFTPYPILGIAARRLKLFKDNGVTSVFFNGSGQDYSTFSDIHAEVLAQLTRHPDADWKKLVRETASKLYPVAGAEIANFIIAQEDFAEQQAQVLPLYEGVNKALTTYLPKEEFITFHDKLRALEPDAGAEERIRLQKLLGALAMTRLEINRIDAKTDGSRSLIEDLRHLPMQNIPAYSEAGWSIDRYISDYQQLLDHEAQTSKKNILKGDQVVALTPLDQDYTDISILTDGVLGIPSNYHSGNLINTPESYMEIAVPDRHNMKKLVLNLAYNPAYKIGLPSQVILRAGDREIKRVEPSYPNNLSGHVRLEFDVPEHTGSLVFTLVRDPELRSMAIDEIEAYE